MLGWLNTLNLSDSYSCEEEEDAQREAGREGGGGSSKNLSIKESVWDTFAELWCLKWEAEDKTPAAIIHVRRLKTIIWWADNAEHQLDRFQHVIISWCREQKHRFLKHLKFLKNNIEKSSL